MKDTYTYYQWKEVQIVYGGDQFLVTPWADPWLYEYSFDFMFDTTEQAYEGLVDSGVDPEESADWVLVKVTEEVVERLI